MTDDDPQTMKRMITYLYTLEYSDEGVANVPAEAVAMSESPSPHSPGKTSITSEEEGTVPGASSDCATPHGSKMMNNVLVYAVAEKYHISELKELAKCKFQTLASSKWPLDDFDAVVEAVFSTTPDKDMGLRQIILDLCGKHFHDILKHEDSRAGLLEFQAIADVVHDAAVRKIDHDQTLLDGALAKQIAMGQEISKTKTDVKKALEQKETLFSQLDAFLGAANSVEECRHCHEKIHSYLERVDSSVGFDLRLRCANCRTKLVV